MSDLGETATREYIGCVATADTDTTYLKRSALLFDRVVSLFPPEPQVPIIQRLVDDAFLQHGMALLPKDQINRAAEEIVHSIRDIPPETMDEARNYDRLMLVGDTFARKFASIANTGMAPNVFIPVLTSTRIAADASTLRAATVSVVFKQLPMPSPATPWEAILEWRADEEARRKYRRLRRWISEIARSELSIADLGELVPTLLDDYEAYMRVHHTKLQKTRFEAICLTAAGVVEGLAKLQFSRATEQLFQLFKEETSILEAELNAPGRELGYVADARKVFG